MSTNKNNKKSSNKVKGSCKLSKYLKASVKLLIKARDLYIRSITECSDSVVFSSAGGGGVPIGCIITTMPRSYSSNSSRSSGDEDFRELVRANSKKFIGNKTESLEFQKRQQVNRNYYMHRSNSAAAVVIGRIDEDKPCDHFPDDLKMTMKPAVVVYPISKSYAVSRRLTGSVSSA